MIIKRLIARKINDLELGSETMASPEALFQQFKAGYENNWQNMQIRPPRVAEAKKEASRLLNNKSVYQKIEIITHVPWWFIGLCHDRESGFNLNTYLGNGQPLDRVTTIVPKGRGPFVGPDAFVDGAVDALRLEHFVGATDWSIARTLFRLEGFNGYGYHSRGVNSPYLWSGSTAYGPPEERAGKFVADGVFDPNKIDPQLGVAVVLKELMGLDNSISFDGASSDPSGSPEPDVTQGEFVLHVQQSLNKLGIDPKLAEDGILGRRTMAAISVFQQQNGLKDTGVPDAATIAAIAERLVQPTEPAPTPVQPTLPTPTPVQPTLPMPAPVQPTLPMPAPDGLSQILQRLQALEQMILSLNNTATTTPPPAPANPNDPVSIVERVLGMARKINLQPGTGTPLPLDSGALSAAQLKQAMDMITAIVGQTKPALGQVNGALGDTIGNLLNGKKTAIGIGGSLVTSLLAAVTSSPNAGGLAGLLGTIAGSAPGLSQFALPIFLAMSAWGVLGKFEKWAQGTAPPPKPQV
jgi:lysozyme family protein/peptidoglycan hydrolase-like protein with peptidoglycan-binding domain